MAWLKEQALSKLPEFTVYKESCDGMRQVVCHDVPAVDAAREFWRCCNNVSAHTGITVKVFITDGLDYTNLAWEHGRGYTYDGKTFSQTPTIEEYN